MRKLSHKEIVQRQSKKLKNPPLPFTIVLNNIRSLYNVGSIFRTADGVGIEKIWLCGFTGHPPNSQISKTAIGAENRIRWEHRKDVTALVKQLKEKGYQIVLLEQIKQSVPFQDFKPKPPVCLVIGNEITGISDELIKLCDSAVEIPMSGIKNSLNVSVAFGIAAYHIRNFLLKAKNRQKPG